MNGKTNVFWKEKLNNNSIMARCVCACVCLAAGKRYTSGDHPKTQTVRKHFKVNYYNLGRAFKVYSIHIQNKRISCPWNIPHLSHDQRRQSFIIITQRVKITGCVQVLFRRVIKWSRVDFFFFFLIPSVWLWFLWKLNVFIKSLR